MSTSLTSSLSILEFTNDVLCKILKHMPCKEQVSAITVCKLFHQSILPLQKDVAKKLCIKSCFPFDPQWGIYKIRDIIIAHETRGLHYLPSRFAALLSDCRNELICTGKAERAYTIFLGHEMIQGTVHLSLELIPDGVKMAINTKGDICSEINIQFPEIKVKFEKSDQSVMVSMVELENEESDYNQIIKLLKGMIPTPSITAESANILIKNLIGN